MRWYISIFPYVSDYRVQKSRRIFMKSSIKRAISVILAVMMVLSLAATGFAAAKNQDYDTNSEGLEKLITGYKPDAGEKDVLDLAPTLKALAEQPDGTSKIVEYKFTGVADDAFNVSSAKVNDKAREFLNTVKELTVADGISAIGKNAFANLPELKKATFKGNAVLGDGAFAGCPKLEEVVFEGDAAIGVKAFCGCTSLKKITFNGDIAFGEEALDCAINLSELVIAKADAKIDGANNLKNSAYVRDYPVDFIMNGTTLVYYKGNDETVTIPENVTVIGSGAFAGSKTLRTVNISRYVDTIRDNAFKDCINLENINFATFGEIKSFGTGIFDNTAYYNNFEGDFFTVGTTLVEYLGSDSAVNIPNTVTAIGADCFKGCYTTNDSDGYTWVVSSIFVPASVTDFGKDCFVLANPDGETYMPKIYTYGGTASADALKAAGIDSVEMPKLADVDGNGAVEPEDARLALRLSVGLDFNTDSKYVHAADLNGDGQVGSDDARTILRIAVSLEAYTPEDLLYMPVSKLEILMAYTKALDTANAFSAGYTKTQSSKVTKDDMCAAAELTFRSTLASKGADKGSKTYARDTADARNNLYPCSLISIKNVASATCTLDRDGKYRINITLKDEADKANADTRKIVPAKTTDFFADSFKGNSWWNSTRESNSLSKFALTYTGCSVDAVIAKDTNKLDSVKQTVGYRFAMDGRINGLAISSRLWKTGDAILERVDTTDYTSFIYNPIVSDRA